MSYPAQLDALPRAKEVATRAAQTVARGARWASPTQCHGLAGNIELLLDVFQVTGKSPGTLIRGNLVGKGTQGDILAPGATVEGNHATAS